MLSNSRITEMAFSTLFYLVSDGPDFVVQKKDYIPRNESCFYAFI